MFPFAQIHRENSVNQTTKDKMSPSQMKVILHFAITHAKVSNAYLQVENTPPLQLTVVHAAFFDQNSDKVELRLKKYKTKIKIRRNVAEACLPSYFRNEREQALQSSRNH